MVWVNVGGVQLITEHRVFFIFINISRSKVSFSFSWVSRLVKQGSLKLISELPQLENHEETLRVLLQFSLQIVFVLVEIIVQIVAPEPLYVIDQMLSVAALILQTLLQMLFNLLYKFPIQGFLHHFDQFSDNKFWIIHCFAKVCLIFFCLFFFRQHSGVENLFFMVKNKSIVLS